MRSVIGFLYCSVFYLYSASHRAIKPLVVSVRSFLIYRYLLPDLLRRLNNSNTPIWLGGGIAYDIQRGHVTRPHKDIDASILAEDLPAVQAVLESAGFGFTHVRHDYYRAAMHGIVIDLFIWRKRGSYREQVNDMFVARIPHDLMMDAPTATLGSEPVQLIRNEMMWLVLPMIQQPADRRLAQAQTVEPGYHFVAEVREISMPLEHRSIDPDIVDNYPTEVPAAKVRLNGR